VKTCQRQQGTKQKRVEIKCEKQNEMQTRKMNLKNMRKSFLLFCFAVVQKRNVNLFVYKMAFSLTQDSKNLMQQGK